MVGLYTPTDYTKAEPAFESDYAKQIPDLIVLQYGLNLLENVINVSIDGSRLRNKADCGVFSKQLNIRLYLALPDYFSIFQTEIMTIKTAAMRIRHRMEIHT